MPDAEGRMNPQDADRLREIIESPIGTTSDDEFPVFGPRDWERLRNGDPDEYRRLYESKPPEVDPEELAFNVEQERKRAAEVKRLTGGTKVTDKRRFR
jgi:hypothetical protein